MDFVVLAGNNRVGKSTIAKILQDVIHRGSTKKVAILSFSDALRFELVELYGLPADIVYDKTIDKTKVIFHLGDYSYDPKIPRAWKEFGYIRSLKSFDNVDISLRELLITHGSFIRRKQDRYYWSKQLEQKIKQLDPSVSMIIIDDPREPDDFEFFSKEGAYIFHLINSVDNGSDYAQLVMNEWIQNNPEQITDTFKVAVPLLKYDAERLCIKNIFPRIIPKKVSSKVYHDWKSNEESNQRVVV